MLFDSRISTPSPGKCTPVLPHLSARYHREFSKTPASKSTAAIDTRDFLGTSKDNDDDIKERFSERTVNDSVFENKKNKALEGRQVLRRKLKVSQKQKAADVIKRTSVDLLGHEWLLKTEHSLEDKLYLIDSVLPTLILGLEALLHETEKRDLIEAKLSKEFENAEVNFNPVNYLARYLMANNPRYSSLNEFSPYVLGLRQVAEKIKQELFWITDSSLSLLKREARESRNHRKALVEYKRVELERRYHLLVSHFADWHVSASGKVEVLLIFNALKSYSSIVDNLSNFAAKNDMKLSKEILTESENPDRALTNEEFAEYLKPFVLDMTKPGFEHFLQHMQNCAFAYSRTARQEARRIALTDVFVACDNAQVGVLDRHRVLKLFAEFYERSNDIVKTSLRDPSKWPVVDAAEVVDHDEETSLIITAPVDPVAEHDVVSSVSDNKADNLYTSSAISAESPSLPSHLQQAPLTESLKPSERPSDNTVTTDAKESIESDRRRTELVFYDGPDSDSNIPKPEKVDSDVMSQKNTDDIKPETQEPNKEELESKPSKKENIADLGPVESEQVDGASKEKFVEVEGQTGETGNKEDSQQPNETELSAAEVGLPTTESAEIRAADVVEEDRKRSAVKFSEDVFLEKEKTMMSEIMSRAESRTRSRATVASSRSGSAFDENSLDLPRFIQLTETFLGDSVHPDAFGRLLDYVENCYVETEDERFERLEQAKKDSRHVMRKINAEQLFNRWDNEGQGYLDLDEVITVLLKYKSGSEVESISKAKRRFLEQKPHLNLKQRLSMQYFYEFLLTLSEEINQKDDEIFELLLDYLSTSVEMSSLEQLRGDLRKKWLHNITDAAEKGGARMEPVYRAVFQAINKDAENHGDSKKISAYIALLERNREPGHTGAKCLSYIATTPDCSSFLLGERLFQDQKCVSFGVIADGKPLHIPRVSLNNNIRFWHPRAEILARDGSFVAIPLNDEHSKTFGLLYVDTVSDMNIKSTFVTHELKFFQGVARSFSLAYHYVDIRRKILQISESASLWLHRRCPHVNQVAYYIGEPDHSQTDFVLRKMMVSVDQSGKTEYILNPPRLQRKDNIFSIIWVRSHLSRHILRVLYHADYLFKCFDTSEPVSADAYSERHLAFPLRDNKGNAIAVADITIGSAKDLAVFEQKEIRRMLRLLQMALKELFAEAEGADRKVVLEIEKDEEIRVDVMFDRLMLQDLWESASRMGETQGFAEMKSYKTPPDLVHKVVKAALCLFNFDQVDSGTFDSWVRCKKYLTGELFQRITAYDPTAILNKVPTKRIWTFIDGMEPGQVAKQGSLPAQYLYNWVFVCLSLIEQSEKHRLNLQEEQNRMKPKTNKTQAQASNTYIPDDVGPSEKMSPEQTADSLVDK